MALFAFLILSSVVVVCSMIHMSCSEEEVSDGPTNADVEIRIGNLPKSTIDQPVYLTWWAAKKSNTPYNPLENPSEAELVTSSHNAYARKGQPDYNGGNVLVGIDGEATIRIQSPAAYQGGWGGRHRRRKSRSVEPHVHFQLCGAAGGAKHKKIEFEDWGVRIKGGCWKSGGQHTVSYKVLSATFLSGSEQQTPNHTVNPAINSMPNSAGNSKSDSELRVRSTKEDNFNVENRSDPQPSLQSENSNIEHLRTAAAEKDFDALEFSEIYTCFERSLFYDQIASSCVDTCSVGTELAHGQCVRPKMVMDHLRIFASWLMNVDCNEKCWADSFSTVLHRVRLEVADHLDVPFQEVKHVRLRKVSDSSTTNAYLHVGVSTSRVSKDPGQVLLQAFLSNTTFASNLLGMSVHEIIAPDDTTEDSSRSGEDLPGEDSDLYAEDYKALAPAKDDTTFTQQGSIAGVDLPWPIIVGGAIILLVLLTCSIVYKYIRSRRQISQSTKASTSIGGIEKTSEANAEPQALDRECHDSEADKNPGLPRAECQV